MSIFGVQELASGRAAILGFTMPIFTVLIGVAPPRRALTGRAAFAGAAVAMAIGLLVSARVAGTDRADRGVLWMLGAAAELGASAR